MFEAAIKRTEEQALIRGKEEGLREGEIKGKEEGLREGLREGRKETIESLLKQGVISQEEAGKVLQGLE